MSEKVGTATFYEMATALLVSARLVAAKIRSCICVAHGPQVPPMWPQQLAS